jgi:flagellar hook-associated protein 3 FlgL
VRVTAHHLIELTSAATSRTQQQVADAAEEASSGLSVAEPSDNVTAWVTAARDRARQAISAGGGDAIATGLDRLQATDGALASLSSVVSNAKQIAIQGASQTLTAVDRTNLAAEANALYQGALAAANAQGSDGTYLLAGAQTGTPPFTAAGAYQGDATKDQVATADGAHHDVSITGDVLTAANGVDVLPTISQLAQALTANDPVAIQAAIGSLSTAITQLSAARAQGGAAQSALNDADASRKQLEQQLEATASQLVDADAVGAASRLAQATQALDISQAVTSKVIASLQSQG